MSDRATKLYEQALDLHETPIFKRFLCMAYGLMSRRMTESDLTTLEMHLRELREEYKGGEDNAEVSQKARAE